MADERATRRGVWLLWTALTLAAACAAAHVAFVAAGSPRAADELFDVWLYHGALIFSAAACLVRAAIGRRARLAWVAFGLGLLAWSAGDIYWVLELAELRRVPYPSLADAGYLAALPFFFVGIAQLSRQRIGRFTAAGWVDGATAFLATAAVGVALLAPALVGLTHGDTAAVMTNLAYPLADLILIAFVVGAVVVSGVRGAGAFLVIGAGLLVWTGADVIYLYQEATSSYTEGWLDTLWTGGALLIGLSAAFSVRHSPSPRTPYRSPLWEPALFAGVGVTLLIWDHFTQLHEAAVWLAGAALFGVAGRLALSFRETDQLLEALHAEAITDALTGLANRRQLLVDLSQALHRASGSERIRLAFFDLDGFKSYNDSFGHPAGDALLRRLGTLLARATAGSGTAYRLGGDEFCVLLRDGAPAVAVERARSALSARGEGFEITASCGQAELPSEAQTPSEALRIVDQRMYAEKAQRSSRVARQTHELLLRILREREPDLGEHAEGVARDAAQMARALSLSAEERDVIHRAAELHDIGKIAIPEEILRKEGPLDATEWELMRRHTLIGERILDTAPALRPVASIVRASHERWDGAGYPDGTAGEEIPLGARIIFVCDAFDAMTSDRPYARSMSEADAIAELRRHAGTQFDPALVRLFAELHAEPSWRDRAARALAAR
jgi:two-component system, cell cycle response regulator